MAAMSPGEIQSAPAIERLELVAEIDTADPQGLPESTPPRRGHLVHLLAAGDQAIVSGSNFLTSMVLARGLSLAEFGRYSLLWLVVLFAANLQMSLIIAPMMSIGPIQRQVPERDYLGSVLSFQLVFTAVSSFLLLSVFAGLWRWGRLVEPSWILPLLAVNIGFQLQDFGRRILFYRKRLAPALLNDCLSYLGQLALIAVLLNKHILSVASTLWAVAITSFLAVAVAVPMMPWPTLRGDFLKNVLHRNWQSARYLSAATLLQWTSGNFFILIAPVFLGPVAAGVMRAGATLMNMTNIWMQGLENSLPSQASAIMLTAGRKGLRKYLMRAVLSLGGLTVIVAVIVSVTPEFWLRLIYGEHLKGYGYVLRFYALLSLVTVINLPLRAGLRSLERTRPIFLGYIATTIYSLVTAPLLGRFFGLKGILFGLIGTQGLLIPILVFNLRRSLRDASPR